MASVDCINTPALEPNTVMINPITLYVDGACRGNPGLGGWGVYIQLPTGEEQELWGGEPNTTNNRMELCAAIEGVKATDPTLPLLVWTDSNYVKQGMTEWLAGWKKKNWRKADGKPVINADLWQQLDDICANRNIDWRWIKGHAGHAGNERADQLANRGADEIAGIGLTTASADEPDCNDAGVNKAVSSKTRLKKNTAQSVNHLVDQEIVFSVESDQMNENKPSNQQDDQPLNLPSDEQTRSSIGSNSLNEPDWLMNDPLGLDMMDYEDQDDSENAHLQPDDPLEDWMDDVAAKTNQQQQQKEQQLAQQQPSNAIKCTPAHLKLNGKRQLILDTETTGFSFKDGDRIIEVGVIEMINRKLTGSSFHVYVNPQRPVGDSENVHGLSDDFLQDKLLFAQIAQELNDYLEGAEIIAHNATFDMNFLEGEFLKAGFASLKNRVEVTDTLAIAKRKHPGQKNSLDALVRRYDIKQRDRTFHGALLDAEILADVYLAMTGGQVTLDINNDENQSNENIRHRQFKQQFSIPVVSASQSETAAHEAWLKQFAEKNANPPIWATVFN